MKKCPYCGGENADIATSCGGCGTEFVVPQDKVVVEATETEAEVPLNETAAPCTSKNEEQQQPSALSVEYWLILGIALSASGYFYTVALVVGLYLLLKRLQPRADWELLIIASGYTGISIVGSLQMLSSGKSPFHFMEPVVVSFAALMVLFTQRRGWAQFLLAYSVVGTLVFLLAALLHIPKGARPEYAVFRAAFYGLGTWLLKRWLNNHKRALASNDGKKHPQTPVA